MQSQEKGRAVLYIRANVPEKSLAPILKAEQLTVNGNYPS